MYAVLLVRAAALAAASSAAIITDAIVGKQRPSLKWESSDLDAAMAGSFQDGSLGSDHLRDPSAIPERVSSDQSRT